MLQLHKGAQIFRHNCRPSHIFWAPVGSISWHSMGDLVCVFKFRRVVHLSENNCFYLPILKSILTFILLLNRCCKQLLLQSRFIKWAIDLGYLQESFCLMGFTIAIKSIGPPNFWYWIVLVNNCKYAKIECCGNKMHQTANMMVYHIVYILN